MSGLYDFTWNDDEIASSLLRVIYKREDEEYAKFHSAENRRKLASEGKALGDGTYPIEDESDLGPALSLIKSGHGNVKAATALFKKRAAALGRSDLIDKLADAKE
jgi:hypothetical protein